jgi:hypothetical protein
MKYCPQCQKQFTENWITFCSDDGTILVDTGYVPSSQPPPPGSQRPAYTPPGSDPSSWRSPDPNAPGGWVAPDERQPIQPPAWQPVQQPAWQPPPAPAIYPRQQPSQGLAVASMIVGILGLVVGLFCFGPIPGIAALVLGLVALSQIKKAPDRNGGRPFAIVGVITGSLSILFYGLFIIIAIIGNLF